MLLVFVCPILQFLIIPRTMCGLLIQHLTHMIVTHNSPNDIIYQCHCLSLILIMFQFQTVALTQIIRQCDNEIGMDIESINCRLMGGEYWLRCQIPLRERCWCRFKFWVCPLEVFEWHKVINKSYLFLVLCECVTTHDLYMWFVTEIISR